ncbi:Calx-beta domain-containing protein, partial [Okeania sp.]|uniref:Calx-beta domain-containing protein n=1 Tax=Okeania sp. TaxID=3100323 RepID=UPI002B4AC144
AVTITRSNGSDGAVSVTLTPSNGTATAPEDYDHTSIVVNFADEETEKNVNIPIVDDSETEGNETINLALSNPTGGATIGTQDTAVLTIVDNEVILGTEAGEILTGDEQDNYINGFGGDDTLNGSGGDDNLFGGSGNNIYDGDDGNDTVSYANNQTSGVIANLETGNVSRKFETWSEDFKILPLGDSNTSGYSKSSPGGYRINLWRSLDGAGYNLDFVGTAYNGPSDIDRDHEGRGAFTINHLIDNTVTQFQGYNTPSVATYTTIEDTLGTYDPDMVLLMAGTNDIREGDDVDTAIADLEELVDRIVIAAPDTHVLVGSILPNTANATREAKTIEFSSRVESEIVQPQVNAGNYVSFVDIFNAPLIPSDFTSDGTHLTSGGYDKLAEVWEDAIINTVVAEDTLIDVENLIGSDGNDELTGNNVANELTGGAGNDTITGGGGDDLFIYSEGDGTDLITDFELSNDLFGLSGGLTFSKLTIEDAGANTEVKVTLTDEVLAVLPGVVANDITSAHFITV